VQLISPLLVDLPAIQLFCFLSGYKMSGSESSSAGGGGSRHLSGEVNLRQLKLQKT